ncbi:immunoglobulin v-set domain-containing protein [Phthorimaea operculella]|nr:immunoglobulin v-set domain-containing protein [Phthorimaea operculella]
MLCLAQDGFRVFIVLSVFKYAAALGPGPQLNIIKIDNVTAVLVTCRAAGVAPYPELVIFINEEATAANSTMVYSMATHHWNIEAKVTTLVKKFVARCELYYQNKSTRDVYASDTKEFIMVRYLDNIELKCDNAQVHPYDKVTWWFTPEKYPSHRTRLHPQQLDYKAKEFHLPKIVAPLNSCQQDNHAITITHLQYNESGIYWCVREPRRHEAGHAEMKKLYHIIVRRRAEIWQSVGLYARRTMIPAYLAFLLSVAIATASNDSISISGEESVEKNGTIVLQCNYEYEDVQDQNILLKWYFTPEDEDNKTMLLYQRFGKNKPFYNTHKIVAKENDAIQISDAQPSDTGNYICSVAEEGGNYKQEIATTHHLTVYSPGSGPRLNTSKVENETGILVTCSAEEVAPKPDLIMRIDDKDLEGLEPVLEYDEATHYWSISSNYTTADESDSFQATCELTFEDASVRHPVYQDTVTYNGSGGAGESTTDSAEATADTTSEEIEDSTTPPKDGSGWLRVSWLLLLAAPLLLALVSH